MEQSQETPKSNKHISAGVVTLIAVVAFLVGFGVFALLNALSGKPTVPTTPGDINKPADGKATLSAETYKDFVRRTNILVFNRNTTDQKLVGLDLYFTFDSIANPSLDSKTAHAYMYSNADPMNDTEKWEEANDEEIKYVNEALGLSDTNVLAVNGYSVVRDYDISKVQEAYKQLFGEELDLTAKSIAFSYNSIECPTYFPERKTLFTGMCIAGEGMQETHTYISDVVLDGDKIYSYFNFIDSDYAFGDWLTESGHTNNTICYDNFDKQPTADCWKYFGNGITYWNYDALHEYRLVFEKNADGDYIYKTLEKVK